VIGIGGTVKNWTLKLIYLGNLQDVGVAWHMALPERWSRGRAYGLKSKILEACFPRQSLKNTLHTLRPGTMTRAPQLLINCTSAWLQLPLQPPFSLALSVCFACHFINKWFWNDGFS
jgi:hypothetical protein